jgi:hypothetical protein
MTWFLFMVGVLLHRRDTKRAEQAAAQASDLEAKIGEEHIEEKI